MFRVFNDSVTSGNLFIRVLHRLVLVFCVREVAGPSGGSCFPIIQIIDQDVMKLVSHVALLGYQVHTMFPGDEALTLPRY